MLPAIIARKTYTDDGNKMWIVAFSLFVADKAYIWREAVEVLLDERTRKKF
jgi:hypothetical protein